MGELEKMDIYACALAMPDPANPICDEWIKEVARQVERNQDDEIYLVGHSLGVPTILRYLEESTMTNVQGTILVSGPSEKNNNRKIDSFLEKPFNFEAIKSKAKRFSVIHGDNDPNVPLANAEFLTDKLRADLVIVPNGGHLNGSGGWLVLPQVLEALRKMFV